MSSRAPSMRKASPAALFSMLVLSFVSGCPAPPGGGASVETIGPAGGMAAHESGATVEIPAGALDSNVDIQIVLNPSDAPARDATLAAYGSVFALLPHGTTFSMPVTIEVPFVPALVPDGETPMLFKADVGGSFAEIPSTVMGNMLVAEIDSFSFVQGQGPAGGTTGPMAVITVTTAVDAVDVDGGDGVTSLREALAAAGSDPTEIRFDPSVFFNATTFAVSPVVMEDTLSIPPGANLVIDGSLTFAGFNAMLTGADTGQNILTVEAGAVVTLRDLRLQGAVNVGAKGLDGVSGVEGAPGEDFWDGVNGTGTLMGETGGDGTDGTPALMVGSAGTDAAGGILNRGELTLERVQLDRLEAHGGNGGIGGAGGSGGNGGDGNESSDFQGAIPGGNGGHAGHGAAGSAGGDGGAAGGAILNFGTLVIRDVVFSNVSAVGGDGGMGGDGGDGGVGGNRGHPSGGVFFVPTFSGDGGDAGDGGNGGSGGSAAAAILNIGTILFESVQPEPSSATSTGGRAGAGGEAGRAGGGGGANSETQTGQGDAADGEPGMVGRDGLAGLDGSEETFHNASPEIDNTFIVSVAREEVSDSSDVNGRTISLRFELLGINETRSLVDWVISPGAGINAADFVDGLPTGGTLEFNAGTNGKSIGFTVADDSIVEGAETFTIMLSNPSGAQLGWSSSLAITITD